MDYECLPDQIVNSLKHSLLAKQSQSLTMPHFKAFTRNGNEVTLNMTKYPLSLRRVLDDFDLALDKGQQVIVLLLQGLQDLESQELVVRNICPTTTFVNEDYSKLMFADIRRLSYEGHADSAQTDTCAPYSYKCMPKFIGNSNSDTH